MTPEEIKLAVTAECDRIMSEAEVVEAHYFGNSPEQVWRIQFKDGTSISCYEEKPADSPQWIYLYRLLGLAERAVETRAQALVDAARNVIDAHDDEHPDWTVYLPSLKDALIVWDGARETA